MTPPLLVFGWGNRSRGDDALGPLFVELLHAQLDAAHAPLVECLEDYQLQPEHALDLRGRRQVLFVDASLDCVAPYDVTRVDAARDVSFTTHALSPAALLQVFQLLEHTPPPAATLLAIRGERFELGASPGGPALAHLAEAVAWGRDWVDAALASRTSAA